MGSKNAVGWVQPKKIDAKTWVIKGDVDKWKEGQEDVEVSNKK